MQEHLITKKNQVEFKNSLVKVLNTNVELVDSKLNIELLESYIKFIYQNNEIVINTDIRNGSEIILICQK